MWLPIFHVLMALTFFGRFTMKLFLILALGLVLSANAFAYSSGVSGDPGQGFNDVETKVATKSVTAGYSDAISKGNGLFYEVADLDGHTVSRDYSGTYNTALATRAHQACIATKDVATGDVAGFPCVTKGYVDYALYSVATALTPITEGDYLCITDAATAKGKFVTCGSGITSDFIALESKAAVADGTIKVMVKSK